jgi:extradiol dioxygenase family protein
MVGHRAPRAIQRPAGRTGDAFFLDPSGNALKFKVFGSDAALFAT